VPRRSIYNPPMRLGKTTGTRKYGQGTRRAESTSTRRMGPLGSPNWHAMLDGAERILRDEGSAALTSRRIAEVIGVKQRLVYYYFQTMDDLIVETFRRLSVREMERLRAAAASKRPIREMWNICIHTGDAPLISEFTALANRIPGLRKEVVRFIEESRAMQVGALSAAIKRKSKPNKIPPVGLALLATSVALSLSREEELGVNAGHKEIVALIGEFLSLMEA
jgi:AcrR family transcriptional regulator